MKNLWLKFELQHGRKARLFCCAILALLAVGCHLPAFPNAVQDFGPRYHPSNFYRRSNVLPLQVRRVAVLPLVTTDSSGFLKSGVDSLSSLVLPELAKTKRFELIPISPEDLRHLTGRTGWRTDELLPQDFFARLENATGCDAVFFCQLTRYEPYQPVAVGWKFALVANPDPGHQPGAGMRDKILWSADEVLDAGEPGVSNAARDYYSQHLRNEQPAADATTILNSPVMFGRYAMASLLETLPVRGLPPH